MTTLIVPPSADWPPSWSPPPQPARIAPAMVSRTTSKPRCFVLLMALLPPSVDSENVRLHSNGDHARSPESELRMTGDPGRASPTSSRCAFGPRSAIRERQSGANDRALADRALDLQPAPECSDPVAYADESETLRVGAPDSVVANLDAERPVVHRRPDLRVLGARVLHH